MMSILAGNMKPGTIGELKVLDQKQWEASGEWFMLLQGGACVFTRNVDEQQSHKMAMC